ncbi:MAG: hypothetical protein MUE33_05080 [Cytophagaceae bacterium]|nr:hypothetical protein [Cytophagaceae bacterium]
MKKSVSYRFFFFLLVMACLPKPPQYPYRPAEELTREALQLSNRLEQYIRLWYAGKARAELPDSLLPKGYNPALFHSFRLVKYDSIRWETQWVSRNAHAIDFDRLMGSFPDPHCTYLLMPVVYAPFGSKVVIEGAFPYCRFFNIQMSPPFDPLEYRYDKWAGKGEVGIVDTDIIPDSGHTNPFLPNGYRLGKKRSYKVEYRMAMGNPSALDPSHRPPFYRAPGTIRYGSGIQPQGPWGEKKGIGAHGRGPFDFGDIWIRYYGIDHDKFPSAGVGFPKVHYELPTGEKFYIQCDFSAFEKHSEQRLKVRAIGNSHPLSFHNPHVGWYKQFGIFRIIAQGLTVALYKDRVREKHKEYVRQLDLGVTGRGQDQPAPASYEPHATGCNYTGYLTTGTSIKKGYVYVLTGRMPTFPHTRMGAATLDTAQCRYWSITSYDASFPFTKLAGVEVTSVMDDEVELTSTRDYVIVYSRPGDKPTNATKDNGVTWVNWNETSIQSFTLRWISVGPEWVMPIAPNETNLPWGQSDWAGKQYNIQLIGKNSHEGFLGPYLPKGHYMRKEDFEKLYIKQDPSALPIYKIK